MKIFLSLAILIGMATAFLPGTALAQGQIAEKPCDDTYFDSLEARAWLEAQREITQNQNLIYKPDSVLSYTCFNAYGKALANIGTYGSQGLFGETKRWGADVLDNLDTAMDQSLNNLVAPALLTYLNSNFAHNYMGGRSTDPSYKNNEMNGGPYACAEMDKVWKKAKCYNFIERAHDGFFTFEEYQNNPDKRELISACTNPQSAWQDRRRIAGLIPATGAAWPFDKMEVYFEEFKKACAKSTPLPTGVKVYTTDDRLPKPFYEEHVCIVPGCYYMPSSATSGSCQ